MRRGLIRACLVTLLFAGVLVLHAGHASASERLLRCATSRFTAAPGHRPPHFAQRRFYAPVDSAMFFSHAGSRCRWNAARRRQG